MQQAEATNKPEAEAATEKTAVMPAAGAVTSELQAFKNHIELYDYLVEKIQKRTVEAIMPVIEQAKDQIDNQLWLNRQMSYSYNPPIRLSTRSSSTSFWDWVFYGYCGLVIAFCLYKIWKKQNWNLG